MNYLDAINRQISEAQSRLDALKEKREKMRTAKQLLEELNISEAFKKIGLQYVSYRILANSVSTRSIAVDVDVFIKTLKAPQNITPMYRSKLMIKANNATEAWDALNTKFSIDINMYSYMGSGNTELSSVQLIYEY